MNGHQSTPAERWLYAAACVLLPVFWGLVMVWVTNQIERLVSRRRPHSEEPDGTSPQPPTLEYHI